MYKKFFVSCVNVAAKHSFANVVAGLVPANVVTRPWRAICLSFFFLLAVHYPLLTVLNAEDAEIKLNSNDGSTSLIIQNNEGIVVSSFIRGQRTAVMSA